MFYLPVFVNQQRMHVLHMHEDDASLQIAHSFVMCAMAEYEVISFPSDRAQLICDNGENVSLCDMDFVLSRLEDSPYQLKYPGMTCYRLDIFPGRGRSEDKDVDKMYIDGHIGNDFTSGDGYFKIVASPKLPDKEFLLEVRYKHVEDSHGHEETTYYAAAIRVFTYRDESSEVCTAALDFGSEASQVYFKGDTTNLNLREAFCELAGYDKDAAYWQGRPDGDKEQLTLYKSIYHIHTRPGKTFLGDLPMNNGDHTLIQTLLRVNHIDYSELVLLPNLKLIELLNYTIQSRDVDFGSHDNTDLIQRQSDSIGSKELSTNILRLILSNFLAVIMYRKRVKTRHSLCLRFTLLVPNVYYQDKVSSIIDGLYEDFDTMCRKHSDKFECYRGIEIQIVSESDASYFGVCLGSSKVVSKKGAYRLIIDAGKGTTDFSLLHQSGPVLSHYESIYRSGIPASGHVLTFAFYEALRDYFNDIGKGEQFETIIRSAYTGDRHTQHLLSFMAALEEQKKIYGKCSEKENVEARAIAEETVNWDNLISYVEWLNSHHLSIPKVSRRIHEKVDSMIKLLETSIILYARDRKITLLNVYLSGRAFRFKPFREALEKKLIESGLITTKDQIEFNDSLAKVACLKGGIADKDYTVNHKSIMLSVPSMKEEVGEVASWRESIRHFLGYDKTITANVDFDFFYEGLRKGDVLNVSIDICGRVIRRGFHASTDVCLYFIGDGYLLKHRNESEILREDAQNYSCDREILEQLTKESIFPFDIESMGYRRDPAHEGKKLMGDNKNNQESDVLLRGESLEPHIEKANENGQKPVKKSYDSKHVSNLDE